MKRRTAALSTLGIAATAALAAGALTWLPDAQASALSPAWYASAPYLMPFDNNPPDPVAVMTATGQKTFQLAFVLAPNGGGCSPTWDGGRDVASDTTVVALISKIRAAGGDVSVSAGGYGGTKLGQTCGSAQATAAAYQKVIDKYQLRAIDFDLEEPEYENDAAIANELGAAQILQRANQGLYVSVTTAATTNGEGTGWFGKQLLNRAKTLGFTPDNYSIMPFDGGFNGSAAQIAALEGFHSTLMSTFGWDAATAYAHEGVSQMNGRSDTGEYFRQADFKAVLDYALGHHLARFTNWSVNRDRQCSTPDPGTTSGTCSSVPQSDWDFTRYSVAFAGGTIPPVTTPSPTRTGGTPSPTGTSPTGTSPTGTSPTGTSPTGTSPTPSSSSSTGRCSGVASWSPTATYLRDDQAVSGNHLWKARWWTYNEVPGRQGADVWADQGSC